MTNEKENKCFAENPYEKNNDDGFQGKFRSSILDLDLLRYGISRDKYIKENGFSLVITCLDLMKEYVLTYMGTTFVFIDEKQFVSFIKDILSPQKVYLSRNPYPMMN